MASVVAYLFFNGNCREAMTFYKECLGGELKLMTAGESPVAAEMPEGAKNSIMHARLESGDIVLLASDDLGSKYTQGNSINLCVNCTSDEEINRFFNNLSQGADVTHPLKVEFWGATFGQLTDKFGMRWMFNYEKNPQQ